MARASTMTSDLYRIEKARTLSQLTATLEGWTLERVNDVIRRRMSAAWRATMSQATVGPNAVADEV